MHFRMVRVCGDRESGMSRFFLSMCDVEIYFWHLRRRMWCCFDNCFTCFVPVFKCCCSDSRNLWTVMRAGGLAPWDLIQPTISLEMPVPSRGHCGFHSFPAVDWFVCLYNYEFWLSLCKIVRSSVILLLPLFTITMPNVTAGGIVFPEVIATW